MASKKHVLCWVLFVDVVEMLQKNNLKFTKMEGDSRITDCFLYVVTPFEIKCIYFTLILEILFSICELML